MSMQYPNEEFQYIEFASKDLGAIKKFYQDAFNWEFTDYGPEYTAFSGAYVHGGFFPGEPIAGSILPIIYSQDLEASQKKVVSAGGIMVRPIFNFPGGRRFHFTDPDGNELAVWSDVA